MSLGLVHPREIQLVVAPPSPRSLAPVQTTTTAASATAPPSPPLPPKKKSRNVLSVASVLSFASIATVASFGSAASVASVASVLSIGSTLSVLSFASVRSTLSVGSNGCTMKLFTDCTTTLDTKATVVLRIPADTWDVMTNCSYEEYRGDRPDECDYQDATIEYSGGDAHTCKVRRKGHTSWRDMDDKPSFKINKIKKNGENVDIRFGEFECFGDSCPLGATTNVWQTNKFTLNNGGIDFYTVHGEVDAYATFRRIGAKATPLAQYATVSVYKGAELMRTDTYAMVESINDDNFMKKFFGEHYALWEVEKDAVENKDHGGDLDVDDITASAQMPDLMNLPLSDMDAAQIQRYYAGEVLTNHWDGACRRNYKNNYYVGFDNRTWTFIPSGLDQTFQGCPIAFVGYSASNPQCLAMEQCFADLACKAEYDEVLRQAEASATRESPTCFEELLPSLFMMSLSLLFSLGSVMTFNGL